MNKVLRNILIAVLIIAILAAAFWYFFLHESYLPANLYSAYAAFLENSGRYEQAAKFYSKAMTVEPEQIEWALKAAAAYEKDVNYTKAEYSLVRSISANPEALDLYLALSRIYIAQDKLLDAERLISACSNETIKEALSSMRPSAPVIQPEGGFTLEPTTFTLSYNGGIAYYSLNEEYPSKEDPAYAEPVALDYGVTTVSALVVSEDGLVSPLVTAEFTVCGEITEVAFEDEAFDTMMRELLGKSRHGEILSTDLWTISELTIPAEIANLSDLHHFVGLKSLTLQSSTASDFSVLTSLPVLETLDLSGSALNQNAIDAIGSIATLTRLNISGCGVRSIDSLTALTGLAQLDASQNSLTDVSALAAMPSLQEVNLSGNQIASITPLAAATQLTVLDLSGNPIEALGAISANTSLTTLKLANCGISDLSPLENKVMLEILDLSENEITDVTPLQNCASLVDLDLSSNQLEDITAITGLLTLENLDVSSNLLKVSPQFPDGTALLTLNLSFNKLEEVDGLTKLHQVNYICLNDNRLTDISAIADLAALLQVDAYHNPLVGVASLEERSIIANYDPGYELPQEILDEMAAEDAAENSTDEPAENTGEFTEETLPSLDGQVEEANQ